MDTCTVHGKPNEGGKEREEMKRRREKSWVQTLHRERQTNPTPHHARHAPLDGLQLLLQHLQRRPAVRNLDEHRRELAVQAQLVLAQLRLGDLVEGAGGLRLRLRQHHHLALEAAHARLERRDLLQDDLEPRLRLLLLARQQRHLALQPRAVQPVLREHLPPELDALCDDVRNE